jgi:L-malate glycosyltransferase
MFPPAILEESMARILFYCHTGHISGAERVLLMILEGLDRQAWTPRLAAPPGQLHDPCLFPSDAPNPVPNVETRVVRPLNARFTARPDKFLEYAASFVQVVADLRREIGTFSPDVVHASTIRSGIAASLANWGSDVRVIWNLCDILPPGHPFNTAIRWLAIVHGRSHMLAASEAAASSFRGKLLKYFPKRVPIHVIHNGVDVHRFTSNLSSRTHVRSELHINSHTCVFGIVGQITPRKGHLGLVRAFASVVRKHPDSLLLVVGAPLFNNDGQYLAELENEARRLDVAEKVKFLGPRRDVDDILRAIDVLVLNSVREPFSLVLLEAQASGTPVVATNVDGVPELIQDRVTGLLVPPQNDASLAEALLTMTTQPSLRDTFSRNGRARVTEHFSATIFRGRVNSLYNSLTPVLDPLGAAGTASGHAV